MTDKTLFKLWIEKDQLRLLKARAKREKVSVAWLVRKAVDRELIAEQGYE